MGSVTRRHERAVTPNAIPRQKLVHPTRGVEPRVPANEVAHGPLRVIGVVGPDGSGKSTLTNDLLIHLQQRQVTERQYLGLISGEVGEKVKRIPLLGPVIERRFTKKARTVQNVKNKLPGLFTALVMYLFSLWRVSKVRRMIRTSDSGVLVLADRFPQADLPGFDYDGPGLIADRSPNRLVRWLARREHRLYEWMADQKPALIIRLNVDAETAFRRKPDHPIAELRDKAEKMPRIGYNGANVCDIDSRLPYPQVLDAALQAIDATLGHMPA